MTHEKHAFLSYVHQDAQAADRVQAALQAAGVRVWRDRDALGPGDLWKTKIREAIQGQSLAFVALVSQSSINKERSYQRPELLLAAEEYQLHPPEAHWLFVARVDDCQLPHLDLGGGRHLSELQWVDLFGDGETAGLVRLTVAIRDLLRDRDSPTEVTDVVVARPTADGGRVGDSVKRLLRDPNGDIELEDRVEEIVDQVASTLEDLTQFPLDPEAFSTATEGVQLTRDLLSRFESAVEPLRECLTLAGTWSRPSSDRTWTRAIERVAAACFTRPERGSSSTLLLGLRQYPLLWLAYATTVAAIERQNFSPSRAVLIDALAKPRDIEGPILAFLNVQQVFNPEWVGSAVAIAEDGGHEVTDGFVRSVELKQIPTRQTPASDLLHDRLRPYFRRQLPIDSRYTDAFDRASVLMDATSLDIRAQRSALGYLPAHPGYGSYTWRNQYAEPRIETVMAGELTPSSPLLAAGFFGGDFERASVAFNNLAQSAGEISWRRR